MLDLFFGGKGSVISQAEGRLLSRWGKYHRTDKLIEKADGRDEQCQSCNEEDGGLQSVDLPVGDG